MFCVMMNFGTSGKNLDGPGVSSSLILVYLYREWSLLVTIFMSDVYHSISIWLSSTICSQTQTRSVYYLPNGLSMPPLR